MRFFEIITVFLSFIIIINFSIRKNRRRETMPIIFITILCTLLHLFLEKYRWQMIPLYALLGLFVLIKKKEARISYSLGLITMWLFALFLPLIIPVVSLPTPTGPFTVGTTIYDWTDSSRTEWFTDNVDDLRNIIVQLWYPSEVLSPAGRVPYMDHISHRVEAIGQRVGLPAFMLSHLNLTETNAYKNIPPANGSFPLIIFSHGLGGMRTQNTVLMEELSSHGYIVAAMDHSFDANTTVFPNLRSDGKLKVADYRSAIPEGTADSAWLKIRNRQLDTRIGDILFTLKQFETKKTLLQHNIDFTKIGVAGHSFGGTTAVLTAMRDDRIKAVVALDGWFVPFALLDSHTKLNVPFLYIGQEKWSSWNEKRHRHYLDLLIEQSKESSYHLSVKDSRHYDYADVPLFSPIASAIGLTGFPNGKEMVRIVNSTTHQFFDKYIKKNPDHRFSISSSPTITVRKNPQTSP